ncbi:hypothetical protein KR044_001656, partial [Drosophila immigrans]
LLLIIDHVIEQLPFQGSAWPVTTLLIMYLLFILKFGKKYMENRKPYNLKNILIGYNIFQVICNGILFSIQFYYYFIDSPYDLECMKSLPSDSSHKSIERTIAYIYFINKIMDLLDTIFIVLRKNYKQITLLHVFHHVIMVYITYCVHRFYGVGGQFFTIGFLNTFVHTIMYFYYLLSAKYPELKGSLWWKKYITLIQIIQFVIITFHSTYILFVNPACEFPRFCHYLIIAGSLTFIVMFTKFFIKAYVMPRKCK